MLQRKSTGHSVVVPGARVVAGTVRRLVPVGWVLAPSTVELGVAEPTLLVVVAAGLEVVGRADDERVAVLLVPEPLGCVVDTVWAVLAGADGERDVAAADGVTAGEPGVALDVSRLVVLGATSAVVPDVAPGESVVEAIGAPVKLAP